MNVNETTTRLEQRVGPSAVDDVRAARAHLDELAGHDVHALAESARRAGEAFRRRQAGQITTPVASSGDDEPVRR